MARIYRPKKGTEDNITHIDGLAPIHHGLATQDQLKMLYNKGVGSIEYVNIGCKIKIENFGPINEGYLEGDGYMDINKVTVFIGDQGSGKSTIAKVISIFTWLEKAVNRGDIDKSRFNYHMFDELFEYQRIHHYFKENTFIHYIGERIEAVYRKDSNPPYPMIHVLENAVYSIPKIMYVPSERNFLSVIENANDVKRLPETLFTFAEELKNAQKEFAGEEIELPVSGVHYKYEESIDASFLIGQGYQVNLLEASSGFQSLVPLFIVSKYLTFELSKEVKDPREKLSVNQSYRLTEEVAKFSLEGLQGEDWKKKIDEVVAKFLNVCFINIVEEPEQNLFPNSQWKMLQSLLKFNNIDKGNKLVLTTHSPYIVNYISIAIQGGYLKGKIDTSKKTNELLPKLYDVIPEESLIFADDVVIYQLEDSTGNIKKLPALLGIPSDKNQLNEILKEGNVLFDKLLEIEEEL